MRGYPGPDSVWLVVHGDGDWTSHDDRDDADEEAARVNQRWPSIGARVIEYAMQPTPSPSNPPETK